MNIKLINPQNRLDNYLEQIFFNRNVDTKVMNKFIYPSEEDIISYKKLKNIDKALECLHRHLQDKILIQVDSDVDGYTSSALLYNYLKTEYPNINLDYQVHDDKSHGLDITQDILDKKYDLIIIPDASSGEIEKHKVTIEDNYLVFETNHFSTYIIGGNKIENPATLDNIGKIIVVNSLSFIALIGALFYKKKNKITN